MTLKARFSLIAVGILVFLIVTPILIMYARGFEYDFATGKITKTGTLMVKTQPDKAEVYLDDKKQKSQTPLNVRFLLPKDYNVRIEKDGYQSWTKRLTINSQLVTRVNYNRDYVALFFTQSPLEQSFTATNPLVSKNADEVVFSEDGEYKVLKINTGKVASLGLVSDLVLPINASRTRFQWQNASKVFEMLLSKTKTAIPEELLGQIKYGESNGDYAIFLFGSDLYSYDLTSLKLIDKNVSQATLALDGIWYIEKEQLKHFNFNNGSTEVVLKSLPTGSDIQILREQNKIFLTLDRTLYVLNDTLEKIYYPVSFAKWDSVSDQLLFGNENEIQVYNPSTKNTSLIVRTLTAISQPMLNFETGYVFFANEGQIKAMELDGRDHRNIYTIVKDAGTNPVFELSPDGRKLYLFNTEKAKIFTIR